MAASLTTVVMSGIAVVMSAWGSDPSLEWHDSYALGMEKASKTGKMLVVYFYEDGLDLKDDKLHRKLMTDKSLQPLVAANVLVRIPISQRVRVGGREIRLIDHGAFAELAKHPGLAVIDLVNPKSEHYGEVVSIYPLNLPGALTTHHLKVLLDLPQGSLTQRTLIWAVRIHPEGPQSADGVFLANLAQESQSHSEYQARLNQQGHHNWESRFHRISSRLPQGHSAQEVCAESWPNKGLIAAALDCVASWRHSSGHWSAVKGRHPYFGYDMKRGGNGVWYATGIFSIRR